MYLKLITVLCFISILTVDTAKILGVFPTPSISHQIVFRPLMLELVNRGHEVVVITPDPVYPAGGSPENYTEIDMKETYKIFVSRRVENPPLEENENIKIHMSIKDCITFVASVFYEQLKSDEVKEIVQNRNISHDFDLLMIEGWLRPAVSLAHIFNDIPVIKYSSVGTFLSEYHVMGAFGHPLYNPMNLCSQCANIENMKWWEKINEIYYQISLMNMFYDLEEHENSMLRSLLGNDMPDLNELNDKVDLLISNAHRTFDLYTPMPPSVVHVGGIYLKEECTLPEDLRHYLDSSKNGVLYISFGSNAQMSWFEKEKLVMMVNVVSRLPYDVLWKWNEEKLPGQTENIRLSKWLPQECLLKHPKIKLFVTQGGLQSTEEAIAAGVPLVGIPMDVDQFGNVEHYVRHKIGVKVMFKNFSEDIFQDALNSVLNDESYRSNMVRLRNQLRDQPLSPLQRAVWWTEHVLRYGGGSHLRAPAANMRWSRYYEMQLLLEVLLLIIVVFCLLYTTCKFLLRFLWCNWKKHDDIECKIYKYNL